MTYQIKISKDINIQDINEILDLIGWGAYLEDQWPIIKDKSTFMVEVLQDNKTIGFARVVDDTRMCMIYDVCVHPRFQKKGIGTLLMQEVLKYINDYNFATISLFYDMNNKGLENFYRKFGFELIPNAMRLKK
ncbi:MAG: GNAT family N-acetyltransferase [Alphaproteobacteria bacterium]|nr:GNAT family N-acetyltransferase [Alphaproteobacteria bacterium]